MSAIPRCFTLVLAVVLLAGCSTNQAASPDRAREPAPAPAPPPPETAEPDAPSAFAWRCEDGRSPVTRFDAESGELVLRMDGTVRVLRQFRTASGAGWAGDDVRFHNRGESALLTTPEGETQCRIDPVGSSDLRAADRGALARGLGNEPGWTVKLFPQRIELVSDYGATRIDWDDAALEKSEQGAEWTASSGEGEVRVELTDESCRDAAGREFPHVVRVRFDDRVLIGCGRWLVDEGKRVRD
ncbi:MAG: MliC family protein [Gammaproteobacteria bacterium]|nr:MliC family protein [Gammaproteobacteria bacterium]